MSVLSHKFFVFQDLRISPVKCLICPRDDFNQHSLQNIDFNISHSNALE